ncbi:hypothetical protein C6989_03285 [Nitrosopumilus sp. b2]|nr:hypothetical protein C6989_03285 [Nitrosopumilus sp. b2]
MIKYFSCCGKKSEYLITYSVAGKEKTYSVCKSCERLDCFSKHIISKITTTQNEKLGVPLQ